MRLLGVKTMAINITLARLKTPKPPPNPPALRPMRPIFLMSYQSFIQLAAEGTIEIDQTRWN